MLRLFKRGRTWYTWVYEGGERKQRSTGCRDKQAAETKAAQWERDAVNPAHAAARATTMSSSLGVMLEVKEELAAAGKLSPRTVDFYREKAGHFTRLFEYARGNASGPHLPFLLSGLKASHVDDYISARRREGASEHTIYKELVTLRVTLKIARRKGLWEGSPEAVMPIAFSAEYSPVERVLSVAEVQKLLAQLTPDRAARVAFIVATSACWGETVRAERQDVTDEGSTVHVRGTKTEKRDRTIPIVSALGRALLAYSIEHAQGTSRMFKPWGNRSRDIFAACDRAGIPRCSPNDLRRTCATWLVAAGAALENVAPIMGHEGTKMLEKVYAKLNVEELRKLLSTQMGEPVNEQTTCSTVATNSAEAAAFVAPVARPEERKAAETNAPGPTRTGGPRIRSPDVLWPNPQRASTLVPKTPRPAAQLQQRPGMVPLREAAKRLGLAYTTAYDACCRGSLAFTQEPKAPGRRALIWVHERDLADFQRRRLASADRERTEDGAGVAP